MEDCITILSSDEEEVPKKVAKLSKPSVSWTGRLAPKKPQQKTIQNFFKVGAKDEKNGRFSDVESGASTSSESSPVGIKKDGQTRTVENTGVLSQFIKDCEKYLKSRDKKIQEKLSKILNLDKKVLSKLSVFVKDLGCVNSNNVFSQIKKILDESKRLQAVIGSEKPEAAEGVEEDGKAVEMDPKEKKLVKYEKLLERIDKKIKELQQREVDFSDDENSAYVLEDRDASPSSELFSRLIQKFQKVYKTYCRLQGSSAVVGKPKIKFEGSRYPEVNLAIQQLLRKKKEAPDYADILKIVRNVNEKESLKLADSLIELTARECFEKAVKVVKNLRTTEFWDSVSGYLQDAPIVVPDDMAKDPELEVKLEENMKVGKERMNEVFEKFVCKQEELKLVPEEYDSDDIEAENDENEENVDQQEIAAEIYTDNDASGVAVNNTDSEGAEVETADGTDDVQEILNESDECEILSGSELECEVDLRNGADQVDEAPVNGDMKMVEDVEDIVDDEWEE